MSVQLPSLISNGMVLQRGVEVTLWGTADETVTVAFQGQTAQALPDMGGSWAVTLRGLQPGGPYTMNINDIALEEVYVGDVWLCSGQSNMQLPMQRVKHMYPEELQNPNANIHQFAVPQRLSFHGPEHSLDGGGWCCAAPQTIGDFSAVGYFFAKRLFERYQVPIGLLLSAVGGTPIHAWMSWGALAAFPELLREAKQCADDTYMARVQAEDEENSKRFFSEIDASDPGLTGQWYARDFDDSSWTERPLLSPWPGIGSIWLRKTVDIPPSLAGKPATLFLGTLLDWDMVYVNGVAVGNTTYRYPPREYTVPALPEGRLVITVRAISKNGGRFMLGKPYLLATSAGSIDLNGKWRFHTGGQAAPLQPETVFQYKPTGFYNGMIAPLKRFSIKGVLWYQGESDTSDPVRYAEKFEALVRDWRADWGVAFPFLFTELAHWGGSVGWDRLRRQQWMSLRIPQTAMAAAFDLGEHNDLHPQNKQAVGDRLARCAMRLAYGEALPPSPFEIVGV